MISRKSLLNRGLSEFWANHPWNTRLVPEITHLKNDPWKFQFNKAARAQFGLTLEKGGNPRLGIAPTFSRTSSWLTTGVLPPPWMSTITTMPSHFRQIPASGGQMLFHAQ
jgi:hypothetical protein